MRYVAESGAGRFMYRNVYNSINYPLLTKKQNEWAEPSTFGLNPFWYITS